MKTFSIHTLGCRVNHYEAQQMATLLRARGLIEIPAGGDLRLVHTCSVTQEAAAKSRQQSRRATRASLPVLSPASQTEKWQKPADSRVRTIVTGCWATSDTQTAQNIPGVDAVLTHHDDIASSLHSLLDIWIAHDTPEPRPQHLGAVGLPLLDEHHQSHQRAFLKIQDGCDAHCTYCIIPSLRPKLWSKPVEDAVAEAQRLVNAGHVEIVLTGIFLGAYGQPTALRRRQSEPTARPLGRLVQALCSRVTGLKRLRISSLEPGDLDPSLLQTFRDHSQVVPHFHLPLQSGSDAILRRMNRQYARDDYLSLVDSIHDSYDRPALTTDIITGFPGETDADFADTFAVARHANFIHVHAFPYSPRPNTAAARWRDQAVDPKIASARLATLQSLAAENAARFRQSFLNQSVNVLVERSKSESSTTRTGRCERYFRVCFNDPSAQPGDLLPVRITDASSEPARGVRA